jgi:hypothetical protein
MSYTVPLRTTSGPGSSISFESAQTTPEVENNFVDVSSSAYARKRAMLMQFQRDLRALGRVARVRWACRHTERRSG